MIFKRFSFLVSLRVLLILVNIVLFAIIFGDNRLFFNQIILLIVLAIQVYELIRYVNKTNRDLSKFLLSIKQKDYAINFSDLKSGRSFRSLYSAFEEIINSYQKVKIEKEAQFRFLLTLIEHINVGIISIEGGDDITLMNNPAKRILNLPDIKSWRGIRAKSPGFTEAVDNIKKEDKRLVEVTVGTEKKTLSLNVSSMKLIGENNRLITFQDIKSEIEQKEVEAWHKLIRILTHEIMNSITPISSLTETMQMVLKDEDGNAKNLQDLNDQAINDILFSLQTIQKRSDAMLEFVEDYRKLTRIPKPQIGSVNINELLQSVNKLMGAELEKQQIKLILKETDDTLSCDMDSSLVEQVLINLITNSIYAVNGKINPQIILSAYEKGPLLIIEVTDNGKGMDKSQMEEIFVPFFSTKPNGSGIGLSLSKQIMSLHHGNIKVDSEKEKGTTFFLEFK